MRVAILCRFFFFFSCNYSLTAPSSLLLYLCTLLCIALPLEYTDVCCRKVFVCACVVPAPFFCLQAVKTSERRLQLLVYLRWWSAVLHVGLFFFFFNNGSLGSKTFVGCRHAVELSLSLPCCNVNFAAHWTGWRLR